ncbi:MAG: hypothetical protein LBG14_06575 [Treponema sp.]|jgi:hypothetical protein|nr:hypothetical protein [Treponema sp.]
MKNKILPLAAAFLLFSMAPFFAAAQTGEERIETGRFGAGEPETNDPPPAEDGLYGSSWLYLGFRAGPSLDIYIPGNDTAFTGGDSYGASLNAALQASAEIVPLFSIQAEAVFTWDHGSLWQYELVNGNNDLSSYQHKFKALSFQFPLLAKLNFYPGKFRVSPFLGAYVILPLGEIETSKHGETASYPYSYSPPLGLLGGVSVELPLGPGLIFADIRYSADLGAPSLRDGDMETYIRHTAALSLGYEFGLIKKRQKTGSAQ